MSQEERGAVGLAIITVIRGAMAGPGQLLSSPSFSLCLALLPTHQIWTAVASGETALPREPFLGMALQSGGKHQWLPFRVL